MAHFHPFLVSVVLLAVPLTKNCHFQFHSPGGADMHLSECRCFQYWLTTLSLRALMLLAGNRVGHLTLKTTLHISIFHYISIFHSIILQFLLVYRSTLVCYCILCQKRKMWGFYWFLLSHRLTKIGWKIAAVIVCMCVPRLISRCQYVHGSYWLLGIWQSLEVVVLVSAAD